MVSRFLQHLPWISVFWNHDKTDSYKYDTGAEARLHTCQQSQGIVLCKCDSASWIKKYTDSCDDTPGINGNQLFLWLSRDREHFFHSGNRKSRTEISGYKRCSGAAMFYLLFWQWAL